MNWKDWWHRLFDDDLKENADPEQRLRPEEPENGHSFGTGRFHDARHTVKVRMLSQYPDGMRKVSGSPVQNRKTQDDGIPEASPAVRPDAPKIPKIPKMPETPTVKDKPTIRQRFRPSKVPSPIFGYRKPPENFYRTDEHRDFYLNPDKEIQEKKQIQEAKAAEKRAAPPLLTPHGNGPVVDSEVTEKPSLTRLPENERDAAQDDAAARAAASTATDSRAANDSLRRPGTADDPVQQESDSLHAEHHADRDEASVHKAGETGAGTRQVETDQPVPAGTRLNRSIHHSGTASRVPFNVLMFRQDREAASRPARPLQQSFANNAAPNSGNRYGSLRLPLSLLDDPPETGGDSGTWISQKQQRLAETLTNFHVAAKVTGYVQGPSVTRFEIQLHPGVKINKVVRLSEDIKLSLAVRQIRIAPVPGKSIVGIEIPNEIRKPVVLKQILSSKAFRESRKPLTVALGQDVAGNQIVTDLATMPHGLIAGATGSGKSVCIHSLIISLIYRNSPADVRLLLIDPKVVELAPYQQIPHLAAPVITEPKEAALALKWAVDEMETRYRKFAAERVRDIEGYNKKLKAVGRETLPYLVIIIDELADLMMTSPQEVEESVCRIAQKARAAGIHLLLATQRPSVDVITGLIKSNIPTRIAFSVSSQADSRTILDSGGAERLLGRGDMLFSGNGMRGQQRLQGCFVSDEEINRVAASSAASQKADYLFSAEDLHERIEDAGNSEDDLLDDAAAFVIEQGQASVSSLQRHFRIGYNRAARLVEDLESRNVVSGANGSKPRRVLITGEHHTDR
ncbi:DNA translocase FtsK [Sporolactobacillus vineae]|uniref:DNA translocase FtsK n=1 Tax=Sporolactobacillus vineae TaxID=444463 RepID=UPI00028A16F5|nr:DNA translocase FtsK [Sporolactobacillus vineae]